MKKLVKVKAAPGRRVPIHPSIATDVGGALLFVDDKEAKTLPDVSFIRRRILAGDLVIEPTPTPNTAVFAAKES